MKDDGIIYQNYTLCSDNITCVYIDVHICTFPYILDKMHMHALLSSLLLLVVVVWDGVLHCGILLAWPP